MDMGGLIMRQARQTAKGRKKWHTMVNNAGKGANID